MSATTKRRTSSQGGANAVLWIALVVLGVAGFFYSSVWLGTVWAGQPFVQQNPFQLLVDLGQNKQAWLPQMSHAAYLLGAAIMLPILARVVYLLVRPKKREIDLAAQYMGKGAQIEPLTKKAVAKKAKQLGIRGTRYPGLFLAKSVLTGEPLFQSFEDTCVDIAGSRAGKSTTRAIPAVLMAPGPVLATSNKPDLVRDCAKARAKRGRVFIFDPQNITGHDGKPTVFFNPLASVKVVADAADLARIFEETTGAVDAKKDAFFSPKGEEVIKHYLLAAGLSGQNFSIVFDWVNSPTDPEPGDILHRHGFTSIAASVREKQKLPEKTRGSIYSEASRIVSFLESAQLLEWLVPGNGREEFRPDAFATSTDTLFLLSQEGAGTAGPIIAALTKAVCDAGVRAGQATNKSGRLSVPLVAVLDEAANICRIRELPALCSHYGSKGILPMVLLQSYEQGQQVWGEFGMAALWSNANVRIYGGSSISGPFLDSIEKLVGTYEYQEKVVSYGPGGKNISYQSRTESILSRRDLAAVPEDRMIIMAGKSHPTLGRAVPWYKDRVLKKLVKNANKEAAAAGKDAT